MTDERVWLGPLLQPERRDWGRCGYLSVGPGPSDFRGARATVTRLHWPEPRVGGLHGIASKYYFGCDPQCHGVRHCSINRSNGTPHQPERHPSNFRSALVEQIACRFQWSREIAFGWAAKNSYNILYFFIFFIQDGASGMKNLSTNAMRDLLEFHIITS